MPLWNLSREKVEDLREQLKKKLDELMELEKKTAEDLWDKDIEILLEALDDQVRIHYYLSIYLYLILLDSPVV